MRRFVNGDETVLDEKAAEVAAIGDRLMVRTGAGAQTAVAVKVDSAIFVSYKGHQYRVEERRSNRHATIQAGSGELRAPMPGQIVDVRNIAGDVVRKGETILVLEAMKTQQPFLAPFDGSVVQIFVRKGDQVTDGTVLALVVPLDAGHE